MKSMSVIKVGEEVYKGVLMCKASESSALSNPTVTIYKEVHCYEFLNERY